MKCPAPARVFVPACPTDQDSPFDPSMRDSDIHAALRILGQEVRQWQEPVLGVVARESRDPFQILIACVLSLRTKDQTTTDASRRLFALASTPSTMRRLSRRRIEAAIYPVGFYRTKAKHIREICRRLLERYGGSVPGAVVEILTLSGGGRRRAQLVGTAVVGECGGWGGIQRDPTS